MPRISSAPWEWASLYGQLDEFAQTKILLAAVGNDCRGAFDQTTAEDALQAAREFIGPTLPERSAPYASLKRKSDLTTALKDVIQSGRSLPQLVLSASINLLLTDFKICPVPLFAFGKWQIPHPNFSPEDLEILIEFGAHYSLRLAEPPISPKCPAGAALAGQGAYSNVYRTTGVDGKTIAIKQPRNLAGYAVSAPLENRISEAASRYFHKDHLPERFYFNPSTHALHREWVEGHTGHELLTNNLIRKDSALWRRLEEFHEQRIAFEKSTGCHLDVHPGNITWCIRRQNWVLTDLGPVPRLSAFYFSDCFDQYREEVWMNRLNRMRLDPIRSVYLHYIEERL